MTGTEVADKLAAMAAKNPTAYSAMGELFKGSPTWGGAMEDAAAGAFLKGVAAGLGLGGIAGNHQKGEVALLGLEMERYAMMLLTNAQMRLERGIP